MRRREFIALLAIYSLAPSIGRAQQAMPVVGFLSSRSPADSEQSLQSFLEGLRESGYVEGQNVAIEYRWGEGRYDRLPAMAVELANRPVTLFVTFGGEPAALAAKAATSSIPIVFAVGSDPVKLGLAESYKRPGANSPDLSGIAKRWIKGRPGQLGRPFRMV